MCDRAGWLLLGRVDPVAGTASCRASYAMLEVPALSPALRNKTTLMTSVAVSRHILASCLLFVPQTSQAWNPVPHPFFSPSPLSALCLQIFFLFHVCVRACARASSCMRALFIYLLFGNACCGCSGTIQRKLWESVFSLCHVGSEY